MVACRISTKNDIDCRQLFAILELIMQDTMWLWDKNGALSWTHPLTWRNLIYYTNSNGILHLMSKFKKSSLSRSNRCLPTFCSTKKWRQSKITRYSIAMMNFVETYIYIYNRRNRFEDARINQYSMDLDQHKLTVLMFGLL